MSVLYTDINAECCAWLGARVEDGSLPPGDVIIADIRDLDDVLLSSYTAVHCFAGIGGLPLGMAWAGWPPGLRVVTGGFPCQDISAAGKGAGLAGKKSGLFWELLRVIATHQPEVFIVENVGALSRRGLDVVAAALGEAGYLVPEAYRLGAWALGAPHVRERWWIVGYRQDARTIAHAAGKRRRAVRKQAAARDVGGAGARPAVWTDPAGERRPAEQHERGGIDSGGGPPSSEGKVQHPRSGSAPRGWGPPLPAAWRRVDDEWMYAGPPVFVYRSGAGREELDPASLAGAPGHSARRPDQTRERGWVVPALPGFEQGEWEEPRLHQRGMGRAVHGLSGRMVDALNRCGVMACGNAVVPQCVAAIAAGILSGIESGEAVVA